MLLMDSEIQLIIKELNADVIYHELDGLGHATFPPILEGKALVYINSSLSEQRQKIVLLHELGHIAKQRDIKDLYDTTMTLKTKFEYGANRFMISYLFEVRINTTGEDPRDVNYIEFMQQNDIPSRDANIVKEVILSY